jgi:hypothetical protein
MRNPAKLDPTGNPFGMIRMHGDHPDRDAIIPRVALRIVHVAEKSVICMRWNNHRDTQSSNNTPQEDRAEYASAAWGWDPSQLTVWVDLGRTRDMPLGLSTC